MMKLLGNLGYGKMVTNVVRHRDVKYCTEIGTSKLPFRPLLLLLHQRSSTTNGFDRNGRMVRRRIRRFVHQDLLLFGATDKSSTKGLSKRHNDIDKDTFLTVLTNRQSRGWFTRGSRVRQSSVMTKVQERAALTYFYGKRKILADALSTAPLEM